MKEVQFQEKLMRAIEVNNLEAIEALVGKSSDRKFTANFEDTSGHTPLTFACFLNRHKKVVELLVEGGADVNRPNKLANTSLALGIVYGNYEVLEYLIDKGFDLSRANDECTALDCALISLDMKTVMLFVLRAPDLEYAFLKKKGYYDKFFYPFHKFALDVVRDGIAYQEILDQSDLYLLMEKYCGLGLVKKYWDAIGGEIRIGGKILDDIIRGPLHRLPDNMNKFITFALENFRLDIIELLLFHRPKEVNQILIGVCKYGIKLVGYIMQQKFKCDLHSADSENKTALFYALKNHMYEEAWLLIKNGAEITGDMPSLGRAMIFISSLIEGSYDDKKFQEGVVKNIIAILQSANTLEAEDAEEIFVYARVQKMQSVRKQLLGFNITREITKTMLEEHNQTLQETRNKSYQSLLCYLLNQYAPQFTIFLIEQEKIDINTIWGDSSLLHRVCANCSHELLAKILTFNPRLNIYDRNGFTPLDIILIDLKIKGDLDYAGLSSVVPTMIRQGAIISINACRDMDIKDLFVGHLMKGVTMILKEHNGNIKEALLQTYQDGHHSMMLQLWQHPKAQSMKPFHLLLHAIELKKYNLAMKICDANVGAIVKEFRAFEGEDAQCVLIKLATLKSHPDLNNAILLLCRTLLGEDLVLRLISMQKEAGALDDATIKNSFLSAEQLGLARVVASLEQYDITKEVEIVQGDLAHGVKVSEIVMIDDIKPIINRPIMSEVTSIMSPDYCKLEDAFKRGGAKVINVLTSMRDEGFYREHGQYFMKKALDAKMENVVSCLIRRGVSVEGVLEYAKRYKLTKIIAALEPAIASVEMVQEASSYSLDTILPPVSDNATSPFMRLIELFDTRPDGPAKEQDAFEILRVVPDINQQDQYGKTLLMHASATKGMVDVAMRIIEMGADLQISDYQGRKVLDYARDVLYNQDVVRRIGGEDAVESYHDFWHQCANPMSLSGENEV